MSNGSSPVIIIGMHRSGTSMITRMLEQVGLFTGRKKDSNSESYLFKFLNQWMLRQCGGNWDYPEPIQHLWSDQAVSDLTERYLRKLMHSRHAHNYMGVKAFLQYRDIAKLPFLWGWKDPRNTYTLPIWLKLFPNAKVIHIMRHGVDVAQSLRVRYQKRLILEQKQFSAKSYWIHKKRRQGFVNTVRCAMLGEGLKLWENYVQEAQTHVAQLGSQAIEMKYEDFLQDAPTHLSILMQFVGLPIEKKKIHSVTNAVNNERAFAFIKDPTLTSLAMKNQERLNAFGYSPKGFQHNLFTNNNTQNVLD